jgi:hypothetical protein
MTKSAKEIYKEIYKDMNEEIEKLGTNLASIIPVITDQIDSELKAQLENLKADIDVYLNPSLYSMTNHVDESYKVCFR